MADEDANKNPREPKPRPPPLELQLVTNNKSDGAGAPQTPMPGPSSAGVVSVGRSNSEREKKIGHRRVTEGGDVTYKKIQTSQIMLSIQLGMRQAIGGLANKPERDVLMHDFLTVEQTYFPSSGSQTTPAHQFTDFHFKTYAPIAFRYFRYLFGIHPIDFLLSLCDTPMRELSNPGASGSIFYVTGDDKFIIKTVQLKECEFLQKLLPGYYLNLNQNPKTLLPKFFALFCYQCIGKNIRLVVMNNLLPSSVEMHQKYDLKGSTYKRKASKQELQKAYPTLKDLDFGNLHPDGICLEPDTYAAIVKTLQRDCRVLESFEIMDYSLLVGIHNLDIAHKQREERRLRYVDSDDEDEVAELQMQRRGNANTNKPDVHINSTPAFPASAPYARQESEFVEADDDIPGGIAARSSKGERLLLYVGIIDILQSYRFTKLLEHTFKAMFHDGDTVSVHRPDFYAERFINFMTKKVFRPKALPPAQKQVAVRRKFGARGRLSFEQSEEHEEKETNGGHVKLLSIVRQTRV